MESIRRSERMNKRVQQLSRCSSPGQNYQSTCPSCGEGSKTNCLSVNCVEDPASICPNCGNTKGDYTFKKCHPAKVTIAGKRYYFCMTSLRCDDCGTIIWNRVRIAALCGRCHMRFDYAMNRKVICRLKGENVITSWKELKERDKSHGEEEAPF